jgi:hypothetical protein
MFVRELMTSDVVCCTPWDEARGVATLMKKTRSGPFQSFPTYPIPCSKESLPIVTSALVSWQMERMRMQS